MRLGLNLGYWGAGNDQSNVTLAEEADRLELSLDVIGAVFAHPSLAGWNGFGLAVQAYQKRCPFVIDWLVDLARRSQQRIMVRLVKGAYWDSEIKRAQVDGLADYPVFTRKPHADLSYLVCASRLLTAPDAVYPQFATHNAQTLSAVFQMAQERGVDDYEFQCLHGMGEPLYEQVTPPDAMGIPCRIYAPVGSHEDLLAYLVRRLLENGVWRVVDPGRVVTKAMPGESAHNFGAAFDVCFVGTDPYLHKYEVVHGTPDPLWALLGETGTKLGLNWGGPLGANDRFKWDRPHFENPQWKSFRSQGG